MSASTRFKISITTKFVAAARVVVDKVNYRIGKLREPLERVSRTTGLDAPWLGTYIGAMIVMVIPLMAYPVIREVIWPNERRLKEEERVRLCIQKGIDPYPYLNYKSFIYGHRLVEYLDKEGTTPQAEDWGEWKFMQRYAERQKIVADAEETQKRNKGKPLNAVRLEVGKVANDYPFTVESRLAFGEPGAGPQREGGQ